MWGHAPDRTFSYPCETDISPETVGDLQRAWFFTTDDTVTATPAVVDGTVYVGDWSGRFYAVDLATGELEWSYQADVHPVVYAGQIVSSAAVADVRDRRLVFFGAGKTVYALDTEDGSLVWARELGETGAGRDDDPTEVESSPVVVDGTVLVGTDVHSSPGGQPAAPTPARLRSTALASPPAAPHRASCTSRQRAPPSHHPRPTSLRAAPASRSTRPPACWAAWPGPRWPTAPRHRCRQAPCPVRWPVDPAAPSARRARPARRPAWHRRRKPPTVPPVAFVPRFDAPLPRAGGSNE
jgi:hypothetical protein